MKKLVFSVLGLTLLAVAPVDAAGKKQRAVLDEGMLQKSWFGSDEIEFREADEFDYLWVKPGVELEGRTLHFAAWPGPEFIGEEADDRDSKDRRLAQEMSEAIPDVFATAFSNAFGSRLQVSQSEGDVLVEGRIVDCTTGSDAAKFWVGMGAGSGSTTIDLRFKDAASGDLLLAIHHRVVSGTTWSTTDSKFVDWADEAADLLARRGPAALYAKGDRVRE